MAVYGKKHMALMKDFEDLAQKVKARGRKGKISPEVTDRVVSLLDEAVATITLGLEVEGNGKGTEAATEGVD